jgi:hypothetical protein
MVVEGEGFMTAALRGAATALMLVMRMPFPFKIFGSTYAAAAFILSKLPANAGLTPHQLVSQIAAVRREHERGALMPARKQPAR